MGTAVQLQMYRDHSARTRMQPQKQQMQMQQRPYSNSAVNARELQVAVGRISTLERELEQTRKRLRKVETGRERELAALREVSRRRRRRRRRRMGAAGNYFH